MYGCNKPNKPPDAPRRAMTANSSTTVAGPHRDHTPYVITLNITPPHPPFSVVARRRAPSPQIFPAPTRAPAGGVCGPSDSHNLVPSEFALLFNSLNSSLYRAAARSSRLYRKHLHTRCVLINIILSQYFCDVCMQSFDGRCGFTTAGGDDI